MTQLLRGYRTCRSPRSGALYQRPPEHSSRVNILTPSTIQLSHVTQGDSSALTDSDSGREGTPLLTPLTKEANASYQSTGNSQMEVELEENHRLLAQPSRSLSQMSSNTLSPPDPDNTSHTNPLWTEVSQRVASQSLCAVLGASYRRIMYASEPCGYND